MEQLFAITEPELVAVSMVDLSEFQPRVKHVHPQGWEPSVSWTGTGGTINTGPLEHEPDDAIWLTLIEDWGLDPASTRIIPGSVQIRAWDTQTPEGIQRLKYYRARIEPIFATEGRADVDELCASIIKRRPAKVEVKTGDLSFLILLSDIQLGKGEGDGTPGTIARVMASLDNAAQRVKDLKKLGRNIESIYIIGLGDIVEGCSGDWYAMQTYQADLNRREQEKVARRLILAYIDRFVDLGYRVVCSCVPGNHGENRKNGKAFTSFDDNADISVFESVAEILSANPDRYANVFMPMDCIEKSTLTATFDLNGVPCGFAHGHQFRGGGGGSINKIESWLKGQALGRLPVADAQLIYSGHFHHFVSSEATSRTVFQTPAQDGGSQWFTESTGQHSPAGLLTMTVGKAAGKRGWNDLAIL